MSADTPQASSASQSCAGCGAFVTDRFVRVFGTNDGRVWACLDCATFTEIRHGAAATRDFEGRVDA